MQLPLCRNAAWPDQGQWSNFMRSDCYNANWLGGTSKNVTFDDDRFLASFMETFWNPGNT